MTELTSAQLQSVVERMDMAIGSVCLERDRQLQKWGDQHRTAAIWAAILAEELGEVADLLLAYPVEQVDGDDSRVLCAKRREHRLLAVLSEAGHQARAILEGANWYAGDSDAPRRGQLHEVTYCAAVAVSWMGDLMREAEQAG